MRRPNPLKSTLSIATLILAAILSTAILSPTDAQNFQFLGTTPVTVGASATLVSAYHARNAITLSVPAGGATVYVSWSNAVTTSTGFPIAAGAALTLQPYNGAVWAIVAAATQTLNVAESY